MLNASSTRYFELPRFIGVLLSHNLYKGAGHKYIRRVPTGNPKRPWRYFYRVTGGQHLGHEDEMKVGAAFALPSHGKLGHFHIISEDGDKVRIKHDESGAEDTVSKTALRAMLHQHHAAAIESARQRVSKDVDAMEQGGTEKQKAKAKAAKAKAEAAFGPGKKAAGAGTVEPERYGGPAPGVKYEDYLANKEKAAAKNRAPGPVEGPERPKIVAPSAVAHRSTTEGESPERRARREDAVQSKRHRDPREIDLPKRNVKTRAKREKIHAPGESYNSESPGEKARLSIGRRRADWKARAEQERAELQEEADARAAKATGDAGSPGSKAAEKIKAAKENLEAKAADAKDETGAKTEEAPKAKKEPKPKESAKLPESIHDTIRRAVSHLNDHSKQIVGNHKIGNAGRGSVAVLEQALPTLANLAEFIKVAPKNNIDPHAVLSEMGAQFPDVGSYARKYIAEGDNQNAKDALAILDQLSPHKPEEPKAAPTPQPFVPKPPPPEEHVKNVYRAEAQKNRHDIRAQLHAGIAEGLAMGRPKHELVANFMTKMAKERKAFNPHVNPRQEAEEAVQQVQADIAAHMHGQPTSIEAADAAEAAKTPAQRYVEKNTSYFNNPFRSKRSAFSDNHLLGKIQMAKDIDAGKSPDEVKANYLASMKSAGHGLDEASAHGAMEAVRKELGLPGTEKKPETKGPAPHEPTHRAYNDERAFESAYKHFSKQDHEDAAERMKQGDSDAHKDAAKMHQAAAKHGTEHPSTRDAINKVLDAREAREAKGKGKGTKGAAKPSDTETSAPDAKPTAGAYGTNDHEVTFGKAATFRGKKNISVHAGSSVDGHRLNIEASSDGSYDLELPYYGSKAKSHDQRLASGLTLPEAKAMAKKMINRGLVPSFKQMQEYTGEYDSPTNILKDARLPVAHEHLAQFHADHLAEQLKGAKHKVKIATSGGDSTVPADHKAGHYYAHRAVGGSGYRVTHGPSGMGVGDVKTKAEAIALANHLHEHAGDAGKDFPFREVDTTAPEHKEDFKRIFDAKKSFDPKSVQAAEVPTKAKKAPSDLGTVDVHHGWGGKVSKLPVTHSSGHYKVANDDGNYLVIHAPSGMRVQSGFGKRKAIAYAKHMHEHAGDAGGNWTLGNADGKSPELLKIKAAHDAWQKENP